jgi:endoglucanase
LKTPLRVAIALALTTMLQACGNAPALNVPTGNGAAAGAAIQVNQVGFLPGAAKWAAVPGVGATAFTVVDAGSGREVFHSSLSPAARWEPAQDEVRLADFSALRTPGEYRLRVAGLADSARFTISPDAYQALNAAALKAFFYNRAGI